MSSGYTHHDTLALEVEESRTAIRHLPALIMSVKVRTVTMVLAYLVLALTVFGLLTASIVAAIFIVRMGLKMRAQKIYMKNLPKSEAERKDFWH